MSYTETITASQATADFLLQAVLEAIENRDCDLQTLATLCRTIRRNSMSDPGAALEMAQQTLNCARQRNSTGAARQVPPGTGISPAQISPAPAALPPIQIDLQMQPPTEPLQVDNVVQASRSRRITIERNGRTGAIEAALVEDS